VAGDRRDCRHVHQTGAGMRPAAGGRKMALFNKRKDGRRKAGGEEKPDGGEEKLKEELSELSAGEQPRKISKAKSEAEAVIKDATMAEVRGVALMGRGRCPECGGRLDPMLFTSVCSQCGWYRQFAPDGGHCQVFLENGETIVCDRIFRVKDQQLLCVKDNTVLSQIAAGHVRRIDFVWGEKELEVARERYRRETAGVCSWCEALLTEVEEKEAPYEEYVAFGAFQERYMFCSLQCLRAFRKQYAVRINRNCYETECSECEQCIKRFDVSRFKRVRIDGRTDGRSGS